MDEMITRSAVPSAVVVVAGVGFAVFVFFFFSVLAVVHGCCWCFFAKARKST